MCNKIYQQWSCGHIRPSGHIRTNRCWHYLEKHRLLRLGVSFDEDSRIGEYEGLCRAGRGGTILQMGRSCVPCRTAFNLRAIEDYNRRLREEFG